MYFTPSKIFIRCAMELERTIDEDCYPPPPRVQTLRAIFAKLEAVSARRPPGPGRHQTNPKDQAHAALAAMTRRRGAGGRDPCRCHQRAHSASPDAGRDIIRDVFGIYLAHRGTAASAVR